MSTCQICEKVFRTTVFTYHDCGWELTPICGKCEKKIRDHDPQTTSFIKDRMKGAYTTGVSCNRCMSWRTVHCGFYFTGRQQVNSYHCDQCDAVTNVWEKT